MGLNSTIGTYFKFGTRVYKIIGKRSNYYLVRSYNERVTFICSSKFGQDMLEYTPSLLEVSIYDSIDKEHQLCEEIEE